MYDGENDTTVCRESRRREREVKSTRSLSLSRSLVRQECFAGSDSKWIRSCVVAFSTVQLVRIPIYTRSPPPTSWATALRNTNRTRAGRTVTLAQSLPSPELRSCVSNCHSHTEGQVDLGMCVGRVRLHLVRFAAFASLCLSRRDSIAARAKSHSKRSHPSPGRVRLHPFVDQSPPVRPSDPHVSATSRRQRL